MTLEVYTARVTYRGADRLDVTRKGLDPVGVAFAPSWRILAPVLRARQAGESDDALWPTYVREYESEMRVSYRARPDLWRDLLGRSDVTLVCYCADPARCHRSLLAGILGKLGAIVHGERDDGRIKTTCRTCGCRKQGGRCRWCDVGKEVPNDR